VLSVSTAFFQICEHTLDLSTSSTHSSRKHPPQNNKARRSAVMARSTRHTTVRCIPLPPDD